MPECENCGFVFEGEDWKTSCKICYKLERGYITGNQAESQRKQRENRLEMEREFWDLIGERVVSDKIEEVYGTWKPFGVEQIPEGYKFKKSYKWTPNWGYWSEISVYKAKGMPDIFVLYLEDASTCFNFCTINRSIFPKKSNKTYIPSAYCGWGYSCH